MRTSWKKALAVLMLVAVMVSAAGCGIFGDFDAAGYVKSAMDASYKGQFDEYVELTDASREEAEQTYQDVVKDFYNAYAENLRLDEEEEDQLCEIVIQLLNNTRYEIKEAVKNDNDVYEVQVAVQKLKNLDNDNAVIMQITDDYTARAEEGEFDDLSMIEIDEMMSKDILEAIITYSQAPTYGDEQIIIVHVEKEAGSNVYSIRDEDFAEVHAALF